MVAAVANIAELLAALVGQFAFVLTEVFAVLSVVMTVAGKANTVVGEAAIAQF